MLCPACGNWVCKVHVGRGSLLLIHDEASITGFVRGCSYTISRFVGRKPANLEDPDALKQQGVCLVDLFHTAAEGGRP